MLYALYEVEGIKVGQLLLKAEVRKLEISDYGSIFCVHMRAHRCWRGTDLCACVSSHTQRAGYGAGRILMPPI